MLSTNKKSQILYYILILYDKNLNSKVKKYMIDKS